MPDNYRERILQADTSNLKERTYTGKKPPKDWEASLKFWEWRRRGRKQPNLRYKFYSAFFGARFKLASVIAGFNITQFGSPICNRCKSLLRCPHEKDHRGYGEKR